MSKEMDDFKKATNNLRTAFNQFTVLSNRYEVTMLGPYEITEEVDAEDVAQFLSHYKHYK